MCSPHSPHKDLGKTFQRASLKSWDSIILQTSLCHNPLHNYTLTHTHTDTLPQGDKILERCTKVKDSKIVDDFTFSFSFIFILKFLSSLALLLIICESEKTLVKPTGM